jgi:hypothetical protein
MARKRRKGSDERPIFDSIRKPIAPPTRKFDDDAREEKIHPALRKTKHKQPPQDDEE